MCYDVAYLLRRSQKYSKRYGNEHDWEDLKKSIPPTYHVQAFSHPDLPVITNDEPERVQAMEWGLVPRWAKDAATATKLANMTPNSRSEDMFNKPSFRDAAKKRHCLVIVDGFFEHHWKDKKSYPYYIFMKNDEPFALAGLWEEWQGKKRVSIVTTSANPMMAKIHNKPKASEGHRMPLIVPKGMEDAWLKPVEDDIDKQALYEWIGPYDQDEMDAYTVPRLRGKAYIGNVPEVNQYLRYEELEPSQGGLF